MPETTLDTAALLMRGISEEEQLAMAIAASLQDQNTSTSSNSSSSNNNDNMAETADSNQELSDDDDDDDVHSGEEEEDHDENEEVAPQPHLSEGLLAGVAIGVVSDQEEVAEDRPFEADETNDIPSSTNTDETINQPINIEQRCDADDSTQELHQEDAVPPLTYTEAEQGQSMESNPIINSLATEEDDSPQTNTDETNDPQTTSVVE